MTKLSDRLRPDIECAPWVIAEVKKLEDRIQAALEAGAHIAEKLADWKRALPTCEEHKPDGGARGNCVICSGIELSHALSRISYLCGEPNEMEVSDYDLHYNEDAVVEQVKKLASRVQELERVCGESYQVVGILADEAGRFEEPAVNKALDNLSDNKLTHDDVLPFPTKVPA